MSKYQSMFTALMQKKVVELPAEVNPHNIVTAWSRYKNKPELKALLRGYSLQVTKLETGETRMQLIKQAAQVQYRIVNVEE